MLVWSQIYAGLAWYRNQSCLNESTNYFSNCQLLVESNGGYDLRPQDDPFGDKDLRFDQFQSYSCGICSYSHKSVMDTLEVLLLALLLELMGRCSILCLLASSRNGAREVAISLYSSQE